MDCAAAYCRAAQLPASIGACAEEGKQEDTQFIFGFTAGADVGELGEKEIEHETIGRLRKRSGSYVGLSDQLLAEFVPVKNFRVEIGLPFAYYDVAGVPGFDDIHRGAFDGFAFSARYKLLDREHSPFALALGIEPHWSLVDENSGERVENYGGDLSIAADTAIVKDSVFGAINLIYDPEVTRLLSTGSWQREATLGFLASITTQVEQGVFIGAEARYLRKYDGLDLSAFAGDALFIGPTMFVRFSRTLAMSGAWGFQTTGHAVGVPGALDLVNFSGARRFFGWNTTSKADAQRASRDLPVVEQERYAVPRVVVRNHSEPDQ